MASSSPASGFFTEAGLDPSGTGSSDFYISQAKMRHLLKYGPAPKFFEGLSIPQVLKNPAVIFRGLEREHQEGGFCYAGIPPHHYLDHNITVPPPPGFTFLIFADSNLRIFEWRWEKSDPETPGHPIEWQTRFKERAWSR
jgi:hypothetical protein